MDDNLFSNRDWWKLDPEHPAHKEHAEDDGALADFVLCCIWIVAAVALACWLGALGYMIFA